MHIMGRVACLVFGLLLAGRAPVVLAADALLLHSPDKRIAVQVHADGTHYDVAYDGKPLLVGAALGIGVDGRRLERDARVLQVSRSEVDRKIAPPVRLQAAQLAERYNEMRIRFANRWSVVFRAYDEGVAYRIETALAGAKVRIDGEKAEFRLAQDWPTWFGDEKSFLSHNERAFNIVEPSRRPPQQLASIPALVKCDDGVRIAIAESAIEDYPGLWLQSDGTTIRGVFPPYPLRVEMKGDRTEKVVQAADYIAVTAGTRALPWRVFGIAANDAGLVANPLVYLLAGPSRIADTGWIKPGKVAWDWYNANNLRGVDFKTGINTRTYKYYIDFAAAHGLEYVILDEGWSDTRDLTKVVPDIDMPALLAYAKQKNVRLILWMVWKTLDEQLDVAMDQFQRWGVAGLKIDFMQRDDQSMMRFYDRVNREAAKRQLLLDYHGAIRPALMAHAWPHILSVEGVRGLEQFKWGEEGIGPGHDLTLPFTRMFVGPMDYTPGAMRNASKENWAPVFEQPMSMGTRAHQMAMYVVYVSPLQMLADAPTSYEAEPEAMRFLGPVPTTWDETRVLQATIGQVLVVARRKGRDWWVGAMTDWTARDLEIPLDFLANGNSVLESWSDGINADRSASDVVRREERVDRTRKLKVHLASGGGWAARIRPE